MKNIRNAERGDVLMEYVLITVLIVVPVVAGSKYFFSAGGSAPETTASAAMALRTSDDFGIVGNDFVRMCRRLFSGLALPVP